MKKTDPHIFKGMRRDLSVSKHNEEYLFDALNVRFTAKEDNTALSITNEKGPREITWATGGTDYKLETELKGTVLGYCVINNYVTVFTKDTSVSSNQDYIYLIDFSLYDDSESTVPLYILYNGNLNFSNIPTIETLGVYENENIQKVYWVDKVNQPRVINITKHLLMDMNIENVAALYNNSSFDFVQELQLNEKVFITKEASSTGMFAAGVIQYAISYYNKYGQESNIVYTSPLLYTSFADRAGSPEENVSNAFKISIFNVDTNFDYLRVYSIFRTTLSGEPTVKRVADIEITKTSTLGTQSQNTSDYYYVSDDEELYVVDSEMNGLNNVFTYYTPVTVTPSKVFTTSGSYIRFTKSDFPNLVLYDRYAKAYYTWGTATTILINTGAQTYNSQSGWFIIGNDGTVAKGTSAAFSASTDKITFVDNGQLGDTIDNSQLLYIGGEEIVASTLTAKDNTLFLGNISITRPSITQFFKDWIQDTASESIISETRPVFLLSTSGSGSSSTTSYKYYNTLNALDLYNGTYYSTNASGFKRGEKYRLGLQFQYKNGKWSEPVYAKDIEQTKSPSMDSSEGYGELDMPMFSLACSLSAFLQYDFKRVRPVVVFPSVSERRIIAQGILAPTVSSIAGLDNNTPYAQSSWFFRCLGNSSIQNVHNKTLFGGLYYDTNSIAMRRSEIWGVPRELSDISESDIASTGTSIYTGSSYIDSQETSNYVTIQRNAMNSIFAVNANIVTMHSPDVEFDDSLYNLSNDNVKLRVIGTVPFTSTVGDISIETSSPTISSDASGFINYPNTGKYEILCAGLFYEDYLVDDYSDDNVTKYRAHQKEQMPFLYMVYPWQKSGSLNNDCIHASESGARSAVLKRKIISNLRYSSNTSYNSDADNWTTYDVTPQIFSSDQVSVLKINGHSYYGNVDTLLTPVVATGGILSMGNDTQIDTSNVSTYKDTILVNLTKKGGRYMFGSSYPGDTAQVKVSGVGDYSDSLLVTKESIRMKYKSTPHYVFQLNNASTGILSGYDDSSSAQLSYSTARATSPINPPLFIGELYRTDGDSEMFGGTTDDALKSNLWIPCGESIPIESSGDTTVKWKYGDTWFQRYDCLKTYSFTEEDENSIVEIASFLCETHVNIDGRYDKNRGQDSNIYMSPQNFNLVNNVYSQQDNFFNYRLLDDDYYNLNNFNSSVMWSLQKTSGSLIDNWTTVTMADVLDVDGTKGAVSALRTWKDNIYCFQDNGISQILFNSRVQIPTSDNNPVEITNNYKVDGTRYLSNSVGSRNPKGIAVTDSGVYFISSTDNALYHISDQGIVNISTTHGFDNWFKSSFNFINSSPATDLTAYYSGLFMKLYYDNTDKDLYVMSQDGLISEHSNLGVGGTSLCFSEKLNEFTSFMSYFGDGLFNVNSGFYVLKDRKIWRMFAGDYNMFFGNYIPYNITLVSNKESNIDKIFTNIELRADLWNDTELLPNVPFQIIRVYNEYQDTDYTPLTFAICKPSNMKRKFRIWKVTIPRDKTHKLDRIRNTWTKIYLGNFSDMPESYAEYADKETLKTAKAEIHDVIVNYYTS